MNRLALEALEDRFAPASVKVVPLGQAVNNVTTFRTLTDALPRAGAGGTVTVLPGAVADATFITVNQANVTIQGDPNVPSSILPLYSLGVNASGVTLKNLNLGFVNVDAAAGGITIHRSTVDTVFITGGAGAPGNNHITQNYITGSLNITGNTNFGAATNDQITDNTFASFASAVITVTADNGAVIRGNQITGGAAITFDQEGNPQTGAAQVGIQVNGGQNLTIESNTIRIPGTGAPGFTGIAIARFDPASAGLDANTPVALPTGKVLTNFIETNRGTGLSIEVPTGGDTSTQLLVQGNDFHNNLVGVRYKGGGGSQIITDLGGGVLGSLGGNNFRDAPNVGNSVSSSIALTNVASGAVLSAKNNIFLAGQNPLNTTFRQGGGQIDVSGNLTEAQGFIQTLFTNFLGRAGSVNELNAWVGVLTAGPDGKQNVLTGLAQSDEALGKIIEGFYLKYLGRVADAGGKAYFLGKIRGGQDLEAVQAEFISSAEFIASNNSDYIQGLFRTFFGRTGSASELSYWYTQLPAMGLQGVAEGFARSQENRAAFIRAGFDRYLHRDVSAADLNFWLNQQGDLLDLLAGLLATQEYQQKG